MPFDPIGITYGQSIPCVSINHAKEITGTVEDVI